MRWPVNRPLACFLPAHPLLPCPPLAHPQTLARSSFSRLEKFLPEHYKAVIVDEAHHAAAPSYLEILARFDSHVEHALGAAGVDTRRVEANEIAPAVEEGMEENVRASADESDEADEFLAPSEDVPPLEADPDALPDSDLPTPAPLLANVDSLGRMRVPLLAFYGDVGPRGRARSRQSVREDRLARRVAEHDQGQVVCLFSLSDARETLRARLCAGASVVSLESAR